MSDTRQDGYSRFATIITKGCLLGVILLCLILLLDTGRDGWSAYSDERGRKMEARISELETQLRLLQEGR